MNIFRELNAHSDRKVGLTGHYIIDTAGFEWLFTKLQDEAHATAEEMQASLAGVGMREEAAEAIAAGMNTWDADSFYKAITAVADGPGMMLGVQSRSYKDGVLTSRETARLFDAGGTTNVYRAQQANRPAAAHGVTRFPQTRAEDSDEPKLDIKGPEDQKTAYEAAAYPVEQAFSKLNSALAKYNLIKEKLSTHPKYKHLWQAYNQQTLFLFQTGSGIPINDLISIYDDAKNDALSHIDSSKTYWQARDEILARLGGYEDQFKKKAGQLEQAEINVFGAGGFDRILAEINAPPTGLKRLKGWVYRNWPF